MTGFDIASFLFNGFFLLRTLMVAQNRDFRLDPSQARGSG
jgi:hypothetical protein